METRHAEFFVAAAEELSFTRAAARVNVVQSTISAGIATLERQVGAPLFVRSTRRVELTAHGRELLPVARALIAAEQTMREIGHGARPGLRGRVRVGLLTNLEILDVPGRLGRFHAEHPQVELSLVTRPRGSSDILRDVRTGRLELGFTGLVPEDTPGLRLRVLLRQPYLVVLPPGHRLSSLSEVPLADLVTEPFVDLPAGFGNRVQFDRLLRRLRLRRRVAIEVPDLGTVPDYVAAGLGVAVVPRQAVAERHRVLVRAVRPELSWELAMAEPADAARRTPAARALADALSSDLPEEWAVTRR
ncbi:MAG: LysR family transcriptional regulator [Nocardioides sp.]|uniref:LysR family transcriptional regulator n=1 Tax=Nocardioides sp. TaxID=35761 RepID=UPI0039E35D20